MNSENRVTLEWNLLLCFWYAILLVVTMAYEASMSSKSSEIAVFFIRILRNDSFFMQRMSYREHLIPRDVVSSMRSYWCCVRLRSDIPFTFIDKKTGQLWTVQAFEASIIAHA